MTPVQSVAKTVTQQIWPADLRISEAFPTTSNFPERGAGKAQPQMLSIAAAYLHAGWRWLERKRTQQLLSRRLRLTETISLGEKRSVSIVQVDGAQFLIGCSTGSVQLLAVLDKQADAAVECAR